MAPLRCPVCRAAMRGTRVCGRCGADLSDVQRIAVHAWRARRAGWAALLAGDVVEALMHAEHAQSLQDDTAGRRLVWLAGLGAASTDAREGADAERLSPSSTSSSRHQDDGGEAGSEPTRATSDRTLDAQSPDGPAGVTGGAPDS